jgi:putative F0F1-ATPase subunit (Ca2+/Mg2+ transporter)
MAGGGVEFAGAILLGVFGGHWLDHRWGTGPWLLLVGTFAGAAAGFYNLYRAIAPTSTGKPGSPSPGGSPPPAAGRDERNPEAPDRGATDRDAADGDVS